MIEIATDVAGAEDLFAPFSAPAFAAAAWEREPVVFRGQAARFAGLLEPSALPGIAERMEAFTFVDRAVLPTPPETLRGPIEEGKLYAVSKLHHEVPALARIARRLRAQLGHPGGLEAVAWLSGPGAGMPLHLGTIPMFCLQLSGSKRWTISRRPAMPWSDRPTYWHEDDGRVVTRDGEAPPEPIEVGELVEVTLHAGNVLFLPSGIWHETAAGTDGSLSVHLRLTPRPIRALLERALERMPELDQPLPIAPALAPGAAPAALQTVIEAAVKRAAVELASLSPAGFEWSAIHRELIASSATPVEEEESAAEATIDRGDSLRWSPEGAAGCAAADDREGARRISLQARGCEVGFDDDEVRGFAEALIRRRRFVAGDAVPWLPETSRSWDSARTLLAALLSMGALERDGGDDGLPGSSAGRAS